MKGNISFLAVLSFIFILVVPPAAGEDCVKGKEEVVKKPAGSCEITTRAGRFSKGLFYIDYNAAGLQCGDKILVEGASVIEESKSLCLEFDPKQGVALPYSMEKSVTFVSEFRNNISAEVSISGYTGGAHPYAVVRRATFDKKTGKPARIETIWGKTNAEKILKQAQVLFDKKKNSQYYQFEPDSFSVAGADGRAKIIFAAPHSTELYRGTTLEIAVTTDNPK